MEANRIVLMPEGFQPETLKKGNTRTYTRLPIIIILLKDIFSEQIFHVNSSDKANRNL